MSQFVAPNQQNVFVTVRMITDSTGVPATAVVAATAGHVIWYRRDGAVVVTDSGSAADMSALTDAHADWEFLHFRAGYYVVAIPDAAFLEGVDTVVVGMDATGISCVAELVTLEPLIKFQGSPSAQTSTTTTFPAGTTPEEGDEIYVVPGTTGERQTRVVTAVSGEVATHRAFSPVLSTTTSTILLIAGDRKLADMRQIADGDDLGPGGAGGQGYGE